MAEYDILYALAAFLLFLTHLAVMVRVTLRPHREPASRIAWILLVTSCR